MQRKHAVIGLASFVGAMLFAGSALAVVAVFSPTGHLNVRSGPGFQYPVVAQMPANARFPSPDAFKIIPGAALWSAA